MRVDSGQKLRNQKKMHKITRKACELDGQKSERKGLVAEAMFDFEWLETGEVMHDLIGVFVGRGRPGSCLQEI